MRVLADPELYRLELRHIFCPGVGGGGARPASSPNVGDFVVRHIGRGRVIVTRCVRGDISVLLNVCAHRGFELCAAEEGRMAASSSVLTMLGIRRPGNLLSAAREGNVRRLGQVPVQPAAGSGGSARRDIVFATFDTSGRTLDDWLGSAGWYNRSRQQCGAESRSVRRCVSMFNGNWKTFMDQPRVTYYPLTLHRFLHEVACSRSAGYRGSRSTFRAGITLSSATRGQRHVRFPAGFPPPSLMKMLTISF